MKTRTEQDIVRRWDDRSPILVSICCLAYNHEEYICNAIDSFLMQETDFPFEIIVHDDASTDSTPAILKDYVRQYPRLIRTVLQSENQYSQGGLISLRFLFPKAKGKYIAFCEGDDYWTDKSKLHKQVKFLEANPEYVITYSDCRPFDHTGFLDQECGGAKEDLGSIDLKKAASIATLTTCFRNVFGELPQELVSARYGDMVTWSLLGHHGKGKYMPDILPAAYRVHDSGLHSKQDDRQRAKLRFSTVSALHAYYRGLGDKKLARYYKIRMLTSRLQWMGFQNLYHSARTLYRLPGKIAKAIKIGTTVKH